MATDPNLEQQLVMLDEQEGREEEVAARDLAERLAMPYDPLDEFHVDPELFRTIPVEVMLRYQFLPLRSEGETLHVVMAAATILLFWLVTQVAFTFHYAHEFYQPDEGPEPFEAGLAFPGNGQPDYWDFFYFSTSIGAASQTSDVSIRTKSLRRLVTLHAILSFFFNTAVLALAINIGASLI